MSSTATDSKMDDTSGRGSRTFGCLVHVQHDFQTGCGEEEAGGSSSHPHPELPSWGNGGEAGPHPSSLALGPAALVPLQLEEKQKCPCKVFCLMTVAERLYEMGLSKGHKMDFHSQEKEATDANLGRERGRIRRPHYSSVPRLPSWTLLSI